MLEGEDICGIKKADLVSLLVFLGEKFPTLDKIGFAFEVTIDKDAGDLAKSIRTEIRAIAEPIRSEAYQKILSELSSLIVRERALTEEDQNEKIETIKRIFSTAPYAHYDEVATLLEIRVPAALNCYQKYLEPLRAHGKIHAPGVQSFKERWENHVSRQIRKVRRDFVNSRPPPPLEVFVPEAAAALDEAGKLLLEMYKHLHAAQGVIDNERAAEARPVMPSVIPPVVDDVSHDSTMGIGIGAAIMLMLGLVGLAFFVFKMVPQ